jgi:Peptidase U49
MTDDVVTPQQTVIALMLGAVPERKDEIETLWTKYNPDVLLVADAKRVTLDADKDRIRFDTKTIDVFWLIGLSGWRAIECYSAAVLLSAASGKTVAGLLEIDEELGAIERNYNERRAAAQALIDAAESALAPWPPDIPQPSADRNALDDAQYRAAYDLTCLAVAFTLLHEFRHVMLDHDTTRPNDLREEEMACDVWAREFMTSKLASYAQEHGHDYSAVLRKRSMGLALATLILHEITPVWDHGGNQSYFSVADRMKAILDNTPLHENDHFWVFAASLLIGIFRQKNVAIGAPSMNARELARYLIDKL